MPCSDMCIFVVLTLGAKIGNKIGVRMTIIIALIFKYISYAMLIFLPNYYAVLAAMCLFGIGSGFGNLTYLKNSWKYFPKSQGFVNGIILGGAGLSSSILTPLADFFIINPDKKPADPDISTIITLSYENEKETNTKENESEKIKIYYNEDAIKASLFQTFFSLKNYILVKLCFCGFCK